MIYGGTGENDISTALRKAQMCVWAYIRDKFKNFDKVVTLSTANALNLDLRDESDHSFIGH